MIVEGLFRGSEKAGERVDGFGMANRRKNLKERDCQSEGGVCL